MTITYRSVKGSKLTNAEQDANISTLEASLTAINSAWGAFTPTVTAASGAFTTVSGAGRYKQVGKTVYFYILVTITTIGTAGTAINVTLPATAQSANFAFSGRENGVTGALLTAWLASTTSLRIQKYDGTFIGANGHIMAVSGSYEAA